MKRKMNGVFLLPLLCALVITISSCAQPQAGIGATNGQKPVASFAVNKTDKEWKNELTPEQYNVLINKGTEMPFTGELLHNDKKGNYVCAACGNELFSSDAKFDSKTGWPSFDKDMGNGKVKIVKDNSEGMERDEVVCARCGGHLGHLFADGPTKTGQRYCINSACLGFNEKGTSVKTAAKTTDTVVLAGGCFWSMQAIFQKLKGVTNVTVGYAGGNKANPTYEEVGSGSTGYAESIQVAYNPDEISLVDILKVFFSVHNPTTLNKQGADVGTQYRSVVFYNSQGQKATADNVISALQNSHAYDEPIVTQVVTNKGFYSAEKYHQDYYNNNKGQAYCSRVVAPKIEKFEKVFAELLKK